MTLYLCPYCKLSGNAELWDNPYGCDAMIVEDQSCPGNTHPLVIDDPIQQILAQEVFTLRKELKELRG